jgi:hypothetical protein
MVLPVNGGSKVLAALLTAALIGACLGVGALWRWINAPDPAPPVVVNAAPAVTTKITVETPLPGEGLTPGGAWPKACELVTVADVTAMLPQAKKVDARGNGGTFEVNLNRGETITVPEANCRIEFDLPRDAEIALRNTSLELRILAVGTPANARLNFDHDDGEPLPLAEGAECRVQVGKLVQCLKGGIVFSVDGHIADDIRFADQVGSAEDFYFEKVRKELAKLVLAKLVQGA